MTTEQRLDVVIDVLETTIAWIAQSAGSPLSVSNAEALLLRLQKARGLK